MNSDDLKRHIAWDIGVAGLGEELAGLLDAVFIRQNYSRLVIDCNRNPGAVDAIPPVSDGIAVPANRELSQGRRLARELAVHAPYHAVIASELARRDGERRKTVLVALHSFTPTMRGSVRPWHIGILHSKGNATFAKTVLRWLIDSGDLIVGDNEPYAMDAVDYTIPRHAFDSGRPYVEIEIRQDLLSSGERQAGWARRLADILAQAATDM